MGCNLCRQSASIHKRSLTSDRARTRSKSTYKISARYRLPRPAIAAVGMLRSVPVISRRHLTVARHYKLSKLQSITVHDCADLHCYLVALQDQDAVCNTTSLHSLSAAFFALATLDNLTIDSMRFTCMHEEAFSSHYLYLIHEEHASRVRQALHPTTGSKEILPPSRLICRRQRQRISPQPS